MCNTLSCLILTILNLDQVGTWNYEGKIGPKPDKVLIITTHTIICWDEDIINSSYGCDYERGISRIVPIGKRISFNQLVGKIACTNSKYYYWRQIIKIWIHGDIHWKMTYVVCLIIYMKLVVYWTIC